MPASQATFKEYEFNIDISNIVGDGKLDEERVKNSYNMRTLNQLNDTIPILKASYNELLAARAKTITSITTAKKLYKYKDSLKTKLAVLENYTKALRPVLTGEITPESIDSIQVEARQRLVDERKLNATKEDSLFREKVERKTRFALTNSTQNRVNVIFFAPLSGNISQNFDSSANHFAVDIVAKAGTPVKATADGTVIFSGWTTETGYVILLKHANNYISVYKHNGNLLKEQGDFVKSGEVIATVGSTGELTTGPHLHFELWSGGYAVNPTNFIDFK